MSLSLIPHNQDRNLTTHGYVLRTVRDAILKGTLPGGVRLIQADIAAQLDVSITPVREALRDLAGEGLVVFDPHRGSRVRSFDLEEVREIYELRMALEPIFVARTIDKVTEDDLAQAENLLAQMKEADNTSAWSELNRQFHATFAQHETASRLAQILEGLRDNASAYVNLSLGASAERRAESDDEHAQLIELYRQKDLDGTIALTLQHLRTTLLTIEQAHENGLL
jgi:DNA-binding GntR family transcriptional regulator